jgi:hypothetical protein
MKEHSVSERCIEVHEIGMALDLPIDDPVRRHAETCPRCRSLLASYLSFIATEPADGPGLERVRRLLDARIRADAARWKPRQSSVRVFWWQTWLRPMPLLAAGLLVVVAAAFWSTRQPEQSSLRDSAPQSRTFVLSPAQVAADGNIHLGWSAMSGADRYQVRLYGPDFSEIYRSSNTPETALTIDRGALPSHLPPTLDLTWRVFALSQGDVIATSAPGSIRTR